MIKEIQDEIGVPLYGDEVSCGITQLYLRDHYGLFFLWFIPNRVD